MYKRKIFDDLLAHLPEKTATVLTGMRRVGKSTALRWLLEQVEHDNKLYLDLERVENRYIFEQRTYRDVQIDLEIAGIDFTRPAVIALDEIQLVREITSIIKYFHDTYPVKFLVTGSSSFYLRNHFSESLAGRKQIFDMTPLDFQEFLWFKGVDDGPLGKFAFQNYQQGIYLKYKEFYEEYLRFGAFPEIALTNTEKGKIAYLKDIVNAYIELDIRLLADFEVSGTLYRLIRLLASQVGSPLDVSKISSILGLDRRKVSAYLDLLEQTFFLYSVTPFTKSMARELSQRRKVYLADTGILQHLAQVSSGQVFENAVFLQLQRLGQVNYYQRKSGQEIDFVFRQNTAVEAKETPHPGDWKVLNNRAATLELPGRLLAGRTAPADGFQNFMWAGMIF